MYSRTELRWTDERQLTAMANAAGVPVIAMQTAIVEAYLGLVRDAPHALPRDPIKGLALASTRGARK